MAYASTTNPTTPAAATASDQARYAARKIANLERVHAIKPFRAGDEELLCGDCLVAIESGPSGFQHSADAIRQLRELADVGRWPRSATPS